MLQPPMTIASPAAASPTHQLVGLPLADSAPDADAPSAPGRSLALPADLLEQVRGRVRLLAGLFLFGFGLAKI